MRQRLTAADRRFLAVCLLLLAASVWFSARYFHRAFPEASIDFRVNRAEAGRLARGFLAARGMRTDGYREASLFGYDDGAKTFLERELGLERANSLMGSRVRLWRWGYRWFRPQQKEEFRADVTPAGEIVGFAHLLPEASSGARLPAGQARTLAEAFLRQAMRRDPAALDFVEGSGVSRPDRTDHVFTWKERDFDVKGATYRLEVTVLGAGIGGYREYLKVPEAWLRSYERMRSGNKAASSIDLAVMLLVVIGLLVTIVARVRARDIRWGRAAVVGAIGGVLFFLSSWNSHPLQEFNYPTTDSYAAFLAQRIFQYILGALASGGLLFVLTAGAEPLYRQCFGGQIALGNLFRMRAVRTRSFFKGAVLGLTLTGIFVAYQTAFYMLAYRLGAWSPADVPYDDLLNTRFPWLFVLFGGFLPAVSEEFLFRMFAIPWLRKLTRSAAAALVLAGFIWGFGHASYPQQPFYIRGVEVGIGGVALGIVMLRWGILPTLVWHYSVDALYTALLLLRSHNAYFVLSGAASAGIMVLPVLIAWIAYLRAGGFEPEAGLTNADEGTAVVTAEPAVAETEQAIPYRRWTVRRHVAAVVVLAGVAGFLLLPVQRFDGAPPFALSEQQARAAADEFVRSRGLAPQSFRTVAFALNRWDDPDVIPLKSAGKYFLERRPVAYLASALRRVVPMHVWVVRYYRPLEKEELRVSVNPEDGSLAGFIHNLPEDLPGADIAPEAARKAGEDFLAARGFDLASLELKENTSERKLARRDYVLVWQAKPGDPRNLDEAHYRVRVEVAGDRITGMANFWKLPEIYLRERSRGNALSTSLMILRIGVIATGIVFGLWILIGNTRSRRLRWRTVILAALPCAALGFGGMLANLPRLMRGYDTAIPLETFYALAATGLLTGAVGLFLGLTCSWGVLLSVWPNALAALRGAARRERGPDAIAAAAVALGLAAFLGHFAALMRDRFHAQALIAPGNATLGSAFPALSIAGGAVSGTVFGLAAMAVTVYVLGCWIRNRVLRFAAVLATIAAFVPSGVHTAGEFALQYAIVLVGAALALAFVAWFARENIFAYVMAAWCLALGPAALDLLSQPSATLRTQGWITVAVLVLTVTPAAWPRRARARSAQTA